MPKYSVKQVLRAIEVANLTHTLDDIVKALGEDPIIAIEGPQARRIAAMLNAGIEALGDDTLGKVPVPGDEGSIGPRLASPLCPC